ncbi:DUF4435 domain-containing protein (plasmid) [Leptospira interrogans]|uniref:DUF4435 domain-containing protein n=1 Tax=Leptospira interrogans TaxID=173 RepID=UPI0003478DA0|nr:DUF4435 domain-containing protein [Leptospira interrogans]ULG90794.1 DUF4435 domain-containing protein [Leptospira interrogans]UML82814.1 DUF4435 domain-containing protein [Leptospira interrogans]
MNLLQQIKEEAKNSISAYTEFLLNYKKEKSDFHLFFEGNDDLSYYVCVINRHCKLMEFSNTYITYGKENAKQIYFRIDWKKYKKNRVLFFLDKDHEEYITNNSQLSKNIFITDHYSIENYVATVNVFRQILKDILHIQINNIVEEYLYKYNTQYKKFVVKMITLNAWIIYNRKNNIKLNLNNLDLSKLYKITASGQFVRNCRNTKYFEILNRQFGVIKEKNIRSPLLQISRTLKLEKCPKKYIRGKYEIWFFVKYVNFVISDNRNKGNKLKINTQLSVSNALEILAPRAEEDSKLVNFIKANCIKC